ncbi:MULTISPECIES: SDR family oxidoreductase [unclassified Mycolicibacterium]|uniref:SDR family oxidoreductase n=1 Tax=unclassified Mycolicibacterium TaxID=2636767 RepID=UPI0012DC88AA|nr:MULTISPECIES: SDR family oxidoreductase [unclassified Mycolicibacterium]MUL85470.1 SDR family oxidoreductase [Mycolicibacterium sp. CBMA 329]MUL88766.1 SDR family oxidoreductase [Mycolicibacterium sp. CBMA 331]MUM01940.1 SDR family oxidoreductase [Mycolicibacterium sp. CBMA 334]MUM24857.1 SDR family oxidoreductase [Mycolicibacterium sp. CBMA 295]MUM40413.1 SDR family oxidoreductase [Mycolicibacterium sp. CBMA 247]
MAEVLVTGGDTELGRVIAAGFLDAGHNVVIAGARREDLELTAKKLDVESIVFDNTDPASVENARTLFPHHLDTLVNVPAPLFEAKDPRTFTLTDLATAWRNALDATVVSAVLTAQIVGDHLRSGGSIVNVVPASPREGSAEAAVKAALGDWTAGQAAFFGTRGITVNAVAPGLSAEPGYDGLGTPPPSVADEFARLSVFLSTPAARHITGQTLHVSRGALATLG